jgi:hypothetical protein
MEKKVLLEITRINELIGTKITKTLINEDNIIASIAKKGLNFFKKNIQKQKTGFNWTVGNIEIGNLAKNKLVQFLEGKIPFDSLSTTDAYYLGRILSQDANIINILYKDIMNNVLRELSAGGESVSEKEFLETIVDDVKINGISIKQKLQQIFRNSTQNANMSHLL